MRARRVLIDLGPLRRYPQFRRLWTGYLVSTLGNQITLVAVPYQVYRITHSTLDVGLVSLAQLGPLLVGSLGGGTLADRVDRRRLLITTQTLLASTSLALALNARQTHPALWAVFLFSAIAAGLSGIDSPTRSALVAVISAVFRGAILQFEAPVALRGRLQAVQTAVVTGGPRLGDLESGAVAAGIGAVDSVIVGGLACLAGVIALMQALPRFGRYEPDVSSRVEMSPGELDVEG